MTCIVGLVDGGVVHMGADSAGVGGWGLTPRVDPKVFRTGPYVIGFTTSYRMGQILRYHVDLPVPRPGVDLMRHMVVDFVGAVRDGFNAQGFAKHDSKQEQGGQFLVGIHGRLFLIDSDYQVGESSAGFDTVGCGHAYALGAMGVTRGDPRRRVLRALRVAERFSAGVRGPFAYINTEEDT